MAWRRRRRAVVVAMAAGLVFALGACGGDGAHRFVGYVQAPADVSAWGLPDLADDGAPLTLRAEDDGLLLVYFGFTNCPDYCPTTLTTVARTIDALGDDGDRIGVAFVSVDPERDADTIVDYVHSFVPGGHAVLTDDELLLATVMAAFGGSFVPATDGGDPVHTTFLYGVNDEGRSVITWTDEMIAKGDLSGDVEALLAGDGYHGLDVESTA